MNYQLNPDFNYIIDPTVKKGYILSKDGRCSVVNEHAMKLITIFRSELEENQRYIKYFNQVKHLQWIVPNRNIDVKVRTVSTPHHLKRVQYEVLLKCNLKCAHCYCSSSPTASIGLSTEAVKHLIDQMAEMGVMYMDFTGGEPLIRKDIFELIKYAQDLGIVVSLFTNSTIITEEIARQLSTLGIASVQTSLDAFSSNLHDEFRGKKGAFHKTVTGIKTLRKHGIPLSVTVMVHKRNCHEIHNLANFIVKELKVPFRLDRVVPSGRALDSDDIALSLPDFYKLVKQLSPDDKPLITKVCDAASGLINKSKIEPSCGVGSSYLFIKHDGRVVLCPTMTERESPIFSVGNIAANSLSDIWENNPTLKIFRGMQCKNIDHCPAAKECRGGCRSNAYLLHGSVDSPDELHCNIHKNVTEDYTPYIKLYENSHPI